LKNEIIFYIEESMDSGYEARALRHSIFTQGEDLNTLRESIIDAVRRHFNPERAPQVVKLHFVREEAIAL
jgi:hypothetical protein